MSEEKEIQEIEPEAQINAVAVNLTWEPPHDCEECGHEHRS